MRVASPPAFPGQAKKAVKPPPPPQRQLCLAGGPTAPTLVYLDGSSALKSCSPTAAKWAPVLADFAAPRAVAAAPDGRALGAVADGVLLVGDLLEDRVAAVARLDERMAVELLALLPSAEETAHLVALVFRDEEAAGYFLSLHSLRAAQHTICEVVHLCEHTPRPTPGESDGPAVRALAAKERLVAVGGRRILSLFEVTKTLELIRIPGTEAIAQVINGTVTSLAIRAGRQKNDWEILVGFASGERLVLVVEESKGFTFAVQRSCVLEVACDPVDAFFDLGDNTLGTIAGKLAWRTYSAQGQNPWECDEDEELPFPPAAVSVVSASAASNFAGQALIVSAAGSVAAWPPSAGN